MSSGFSDSTVPPPATMRGKSWPCLRQFCIFMENRVGRLHELLRLLEGRDLRIIALSVVDTVDFAVARVMVDDADRVREIFDLSGFTYMENDILGVQLPAESDPFARVFSALLSAELNINYTYPLLYRRDGRTAIAMHLDDIDQAGDVLTQLGYRLVTESDLLNNDDYL